MGRGLAGFKARAGVEFQVPVYSARTQNLLVDGHSYFGRTAPATEAVKLNFGQNQPVMGWGHGGKHVECAHKRAPHMLFSCTNVRRTLNPAHTMLINNMFFIQHIV